MGKTADARLLLLLLTLNKCEKQPQCNAIGKRDFAWSVNHLTLKRLRGMGSIWPPAVFPEMCFLKRERETESGTQFFFVAFNIIKSHVFPENFTEIPQVVQKMWRFSLSILTTSKFFCFLLYFLVTKKLMMSAYNR